MESKTALQFRKYSAIIKPLVFISLLILISVLLNSCGEDKCEVTRSYIYYEPVHTSLQTVRASVRMEAPREIESAGRIYFKDDYLFINEPGEGIHIIDNRKPSSPLIQSFIKIPGNYDLAIKGPILYADSYLDLLSFDVSDLNNVRLLERQENFLSTKNTGFMGFHVDASRNMVTTYRQERRVEITESNCNAFLEPWGGRFWGGGLIMLEAANFSRGDALNIVGGGNNTTGIGGSMARFTIVDNYLYMLNNNGLETASLTNPVKPELVNSINIGWGLETIFPHTDKLFIGSTTGMHIIDIATPASPQHLSTYTHVFACDPVVVSGNYAYVTLRTGTACRITNINQLELIDITDLRNPKLVKEFQMHNPQGLGIDRDILFLCDGDDGLKIFDINDPLQLDKKRLAWHKNINAYDVIPYKNVLMMIGKGGLYQYSYANPNNIQQISHIKFGNL